MGPATRELPPMRRRSALRFAAGRAPFSASKRAGSRGTLGRRLGTDQGADRSASRARSRTRSGMDCGAARDAKCLTKGAPSLSCARFAQFSVPGRSFVGSPSTRSTDASHALCHFNGSGSPSSKSLALHLSQESASLRHFTEKPLKNRQIHDRRRILLL